MHPAGERLSGQDQVRESWAKIFAAGPQARVRIEQQVAISAMMLAVHSVFEPSRSRTNPRRSRAGHRHQRLPAHRRGLAHDRAPRLPRAGAAAGGAARRPAQDPSLRCIPLRGGCPEGTCRRSTPRCGRRRASRSSASAGRRPTATSSTSISPATPRRRGGWCCSTVSRARPTATTRAPSPRTRRRRAGASRIAALPRLLGRAQPHAARLSLGGYGGDRLGAAKRWELRYARRHLPRRQCAAEMARRARRRSAARWCGAPRRCRRRSTSPPPGTRSTAGSTAALHAALPVHAQAQVARQARALPGPLRRGESARRAHASASSTTW